MAYRGFVGAGGTADVFVFTLDLSPWQRMSGLGKGQILVTDSGLC